ncbi:DUF4873 domain-containing protein [Mycolicibacillus trivialis]
MTAAPGTDPVDVLVIGDPARTHGRFAYGAVVAAPARTRFDSATDTWTVTGADGQSHSARIVVDTTAREDRIVAAHGVPNHFRIPGPHTARQARYVGAVVAGALRGGATRVEARSRLRVHPVLPTRGLSRFYLAGSVGVDEDSYDGPATLTHAGEEYPVRVRLTGHFDPIDGRYHWQGMLYADLPGERVTGSRVSLRIGEHSADATISDRTPWGTLSVRGAAGFPPFPLETVELALPPRL